jgi:competence protein ComEC
MNFTFKKFLAGFVILLAVVFVGQEITDIRNDRTESLEVNFLDVGQGDANLINYLGKYQVLIDGGPNGKEFLYQLGKVMPWSDKEIEVVVLTHPDEDHLAGLIDLVENYKIGVFLYNGQLAETEIYKQLQEALVEKNIKQEVLMEGSNIDIGKHLKLKVFNPDILVTGDKRRNEQSVVLRMDFGENSFLFAGDAGIETEDAMIADREDLDVDYFKVGHHGSKYSTSEEFLSRVTPEYAVISSGKDNRFGHPTEEVLERLGSVNAEIFRTDEKGTVRIICGGIKAKCRVE